MTKLADPDDKWGTLQEVEQLYRREKDSRLKQRINAIRLLMKGRKQVEVADVLGVSVTTVRNWRGLWDNGGLEGLKPRHIGSVSKVTPAMKAEIEQIIDIEREIDGRKVSGKLIVGFLKKNTG